MNSFYFLSVFCPHWMRCCVANEIVHSEKPWNNHHIFIFLWWRRSHQRISSISNTRRINGNYLYWTAVKMAFLRNYTLLHRFAEIKWWTKAPVDLLFSIKFTNNLHLNIMQLVISSAICTSWLQKEKFFFLLSWLWDFFA